MYFKPAHHEPSQLVDPTVGIASSWGCRRDKHLGRYLDGTHCQRFGPLEDDHEDDKGGNENRKGVAGQVQQSRVHCERSLFLDFIPVSGLRL